jgi:hypothetical protein
MNIKKVLLLVSLVFLFPLSSVSASIDNNFYDVALKGAWHVPDTGIKTRYDITTGTKAIYRQITTPPNLLYIDLSEKNTFITDDMGMAAFEVDRFGNVVWEKKIYGQTYFGIAPLNDDELLLNMLSYGRMVKINKKTKAETIIKIGLFRDVAVTNQGLILTVESTQNGRVLLMSTDGTTVWQSEPAFYYARGVWQKKNGNILVVDFRNKAYEIDYNTNKIIWEMGGLSYPNSIQEMINGNYLITDEHNNRIIEVNPADKSIVRSYSDGLWSPNYAKELDNGDWLISDTDNHRVIQVNDQDNIVWEMSNLHAPNRAVR